MVVLWFLTVGGAEPTLGRNCTPDVGEVRVGPEGAAAGRGERHRREVRRDQDLRRCGPPAHPRFRQDREVRLSLGCYLRTGGLFAAALFVFFFLFLFCALFGRVAAVRMSATLLVVWRFENCPCRPAGGEE